MSDVKEDAGDSRDEDHPKEEEREQLDDNELLNIRIPTQTKKSQKRKHIKINFDSADTDATVREAQRREKERLERLEKAKPQNDHIVHFESLLAASQNESVLPELNLSNQDFGDDLDVFGVFGPDADDIDQKRFKADFKTEEQKPSFLMTSNQPSTSKGPVDLVDLTEDSDEDDCMITGVRSVPQPGRRIRWAQAEKDKLDVDQMEMQHSVEAKRIQKARSQTDLESTEKCGGRLLVNSGHPAEDPDIFVMAHLTQVLQPHQLGGIRFMYDNTVESISEFKNSSGFGCILAHSMGLGKTIQVITFSEIFLRATKSKKVLIIVPVNTIQNWYSEYDKWIPRFSEFGDRIRQFEVFLLGDSVKTFDQRVNLIEQWDQKGGVLIIGYDMFRTLIKMTQKKKEKKGRPKLNLSGVSSGFNRAEEAQKKEDELTFDMGFTSGGRVRQEAFEILRRALLEPGPDLVVCDEGHKIKNITAEISMTLGAIHTKRRIVLTGYPLQNNLMEYYCMIDFVRPKYLGNRKSFIERFEKPIKNGQCVDSTKADVKIALQRTHVLVELVKGFVQRRTHHLLKKILPESKEYVLLLRKSQIQRQLYRNFVLYAKHELSHSSDSTFNPLMAFSACSKFWNHPDILFRVVEQMRKNEWAAEEKKRNAEANKIMQQQQQHQMMHNGMMMGYGGSPFQMPQSPQVMMNHYFFQGMWQPNGYHQMPPSPFSMSSNPSTPSTSTPTSSKKGRKPRTSKKSSNKSDEEDEDGEKETRMRYDWSYDSFAQYQEGVLENGYKMAIALQILDESTRIGEKILIFSQNLPALDMLEEVLRKQRIVVKDGHGGYWEKHRNYLRLDGQTSGADREKLINRFNSEAGLHLFLISTRAGSLGINLVSANRCIIIDACWNPCHDAQAVCRVYRYGQQKKTYVYRLIMDNSMERSIFNRQISKHGLQQRVVDDAQVDANISQKELETLLMYEEAKDVGHDTWDTDDWEFGDDILETITKKMSHMFAEKPFLHESLIMESEKALSEEEKREAQLLFEQEKRQENYDPLAGLSTSMLAPPSSTSLSSSSSFNQWQPNVQPPFTTRYQPPSMPHTLRINLPNYGGGHTMTSYNGFMNNNNGMGQMLPPRDPSAFMGAAKSSPPKITKSGACQNVITDRAMCFPIVGQASHNLKQVAANTPVQLVVPQVGFFIRLQSGEILKAEGSPLEQRCRELHTLFTNYDFNKVTEVIDLD